MRNSERGARTRTSLQSACHGKFLFRTLQSTLRTGVVLWSDSHRALARGHHTSLQNSSLLLRHRGNEIYVLRFNEQQWTPALHRYRWSRSDTLALRPPPTRVLLG